MDLTDKFKAMPITNLAPQSPDRFILDMVRGIRQVVVRSVSYVGEECANHARGSHTYRDQTGNLTSSIGYVISVDGQLVKTGDFNTVKDGSHGSAGGKDYAMQSASLFPQGIALIIVAGMDYAAHVSNKGYDVIDSAELKAGPLLRELLSKSGIKL